YHSDSPGAITLLQVIDKTISAMGGRMLKRWLALPLKNPDRIRERHEVVGYLVKNQHLLQKIQQYIKRIGDLERLVSKMATGKMNPREMIQLKNSLKAVIPIQKLVLESNNEALVTLGSSFYALENLRQRIKQTLNEEAPIQIQKGQAIAPGFSTELD